MSQEQEPSLRLRIGDEETLEMTPSNGVLYTFLGKTAIADFEFENSNANHVYVGMGEDEEGRSKGMYLFEAHHPAFDDVAGFILEHDFPQILNMREVPECDLKAYWNNADRITKKEAEEIPDFPPEDML